MLYQYFQMILDDFEDSKVQDMDFGWFWVYFADQPGVLVEYVESHHYSGSNNSKIPWGGPCSSGDESKCETLKTAICINVLVSFCPNHQNQLAPGVGQRHDHGHDDDEDDDDDYDHDDENQLTGIYHITYHYIPTVSSRSDIDGPLIPSKNWLNLPFAPPSQLLPRGWSWSCWHQCQVCPWPCKGPLLYWAGVVEYIHSMCIL